MGQNTTYGNCFLHPISNIIYHDCPCQIIATAFFGDSGDGGHCSEREGCLAAF